MNNLKRIRVKVSVSMLKTCKRKKRRYRQIARLLYRYCCVMYMKRVSGEVKTNEEYIRSCSTDELTTLLCALVDTGILNAWTIMYHCDDSDRDAVRIWLQKTYEGNKE